MWSSNSTSGNIPEELKAGPQTDAHTPAFTQAQPAVHTAQCESSPGAHEWTQAKQNVRSVILFSLKIEWNSDPLYNVCVLGRHSEWDKPVRARKALYDSRPRVVMLIGQRVSWVDGAVWQTPLTSSVNQSVASWMYLALLGCTINDAYCGVVVIFICQIYNAESPGKGVSLKNCLN